FGLRHPRGAVGRCGGPHRSVLFEGSSFYEFDSAFGRGFAVEPDQIVVGRETPGGGHTIDSRRDFGQCFVYLVHGLSNPRQPEVAQANRTSNPKGELSKTRCNRNRRGAHLARQERGAPYAPRRTDSGGDLRRLSGTHLS